MRKLRLREIKQLVQGHSGTQVCLIPKPMVRATAYKFGRSLCPDKPMTQRQMRSRQHREQSCVLGREDTQRSWMVMFGIQASFEAEDSWEAMIFPIPIRGQHKICDLGRGRRGPILVLQLWFLHSPLSGGRYLLRAATLIIILREDFGSRKFDEFMRSAAIFPRRV